MCSEDKLNSAKKYIDQAENSIRDKNFKNAISNYHRQVVENGPFMFFNFPCLNSGLFYI